MKKRNYIFLLFVFVVNIFFAQNRQILYGFNDLPQSLMLNPGAEVNFDKHFGIPLLSNIYVQIGATNKKVTYNNVYEDTVSNSEVLRNLYDLKQTDKDFYKINQQIEILNGGLRLRNPNLYLSFGIYQEIDGYAAYPDEFMDMYYYGDYTEDNKLRIGEKTRFDNLNLTGELVGVFHAGLSVKVSETLNFGVRFKLLSGSLNINSRANKGYYVLNSKKPYDHQFNTMSLRTNTSGLINNSGESVLGSFGEVVSGLFFMQGNMGMGLDLGLTYHVNDEIEIAASVLDLDYLSYSNKITTYEVRNDFDLVTDKAFDPEVDNERSYWEDVLDLGDIEESTIVPVEVFNSKYNFFRSPKLYTSATYQIIRNKYKKKGHSVFRNTRYVTPFVRKMKTEFGLQTYTAFRPDRIDWAITAMAAHDFNQYISAKLTYTYDYFSAKNIGLGLSAHFKSFNFFAAADNLLNLYKIKDSNYQSFQLGMNFIFSN